MGRGIYHFKPWKDRKLQRLAIWLQKHNFSANVITFCGLLFGLSGALTLAKHHPFWGLILIISSIFTDLLDGTVARIGNQETVGGKMFDAISDRLVESSLVAALIYLGQLPWWGWLLPLGSVLLLINRYLAFCLSINTSFVFIARFERMAAIIAIIAIPRPWLTHSLYFLAIGGTFISNLMIVRTILNKRAEPFNRRFVI